jgi:hypothetical protein
MISQQRDRRGCLATPILASQEEARPRKRSRASLRTSVIACASAQSSKYPPAEPGALMIGPLKAAIGVADATPIFWAT